MSVEVLEGTFGHHTSSTTELRSLSYYHSFEQSFKDTLTPGVGLGLSDRSDGTATLGCYIKLVLRPKTCPEGQAPKEETVWFALTAHHALSGMLTFLNYLLLSTVPHSHRVSTSQMTSIKFIQRTRPTRQPLCKAQPPWNMSSRRLLYMMVPRAMTHLPRPINMTWQSSMPSNRLVQRSLQRRRTSSNSSMRRPDSLDLILI